MSTIEFHDVSFGYSSDRLVLHDINLTISEPGLYCIIGPNGVGKSTIMKCLNKIIEPQKGFISLDGEDISALRYKQIAPKVGYVPVFSNDAFSMDVIDTILIGRFNHIKECSRKDNLKKVYEAMKLLHIEGLAYQKFNNISAGQHQRVALARGLVQDTPVILLDEPTANLDVKYQVYVMELLRGIAEKKHKIIITICHDLNITARFAHHVIMLSRPGVVYAYGSPQEVLTKDNIEKVYGVQCEILYGIGRSLMSEEENTPYIVLGHAVISDQDVD